jgi:NitT/TauT family transport system substrate-binding protein
VNVRPLIVALLAALCMAFGGAAFAADDLAPAAAPVTLLLAGQQGAVSTALFYGIEQGIFKKHGIDLKITAPTGASTTSNVTAVESGKYDMGTMGAPAALVYRQKYGGDVVIFYGFVQNNPKCIVVGQNSGINSVKDLKGKKIAFASNSPYSDLITFLQQSGLGPNDYTLVPLSNSAVNALYISGQVDAALSYDENMPIFNDRGKPSKAFCERFGGLNYQQTDIGTTQAFISAHRDVVARFADALTETIEASRANPSEAAGAVYRAYPAQKPVGPQVGLQQFQYVLDYFKTKNDGGHGYGWMSAKDWAETQAIAIKFFGLKPGLDFRTGWTDEFVR